MYTTTIIIIIIITIIIIIIKKSVWGIRFVNTPMNEEAKIERIGSNYILL